MNNLRVASCLTAAMMLCGCRTSPEPLVSGPTSVRPPFPIVAVENRNTGSLYRPDIAVNFFQDAPLAHRIGDKIKIEIAENSSGSNKASTATKRSNSVATKGPGTNDESLNQLLRSLLNLNVEASGKDTFEGDGQTDTASSLKGKLAATVINVLPNGNLQIAGERSIAFNGEVNTLRLSGVVIPADLKPGNVVASEDVMEARLEQVGRGNINASNSKTWIQRMLTDSLSIW